MKKYYERIGTHTLAWKLYGVTSTKIQRGTIFEVLKA